jgi:aryl-phospho-beta-D-glucosidase BglC (GH1 family)
MMARTLGKLVTMSAVASVLLAALVGGGARATASGRHSGRLSGTLHTSGTSIYTAADRPVRLLGFNWTGTEAGGRSDYLKQPDACSRVWRTPADRLPGVPVDYDNMYQVLHDWGFNTIRIPISWNDLEPQPPVWNDSTGRYVHTWNTAYVDDLKSMVTKAKAAGLYVVLDMHQDFWGPALHHIVLSNGQSGMCEGIGMPRWLDPSIDAKATAQQSVDYRHAMNWFYRDLPDPYSTLTHTTPWRLFEGAWGELSHVFSAQSGFRASSAVVGADILNEPYARYVGADPASGQSVLQAAAVRLHDFYTTTAPAIARVDPGWLLFFEDSTGSYNSAHPSDRETPVLTGKPGGNFNWVYSTHVYDFAYGTFSDGVQQHDDYGITLVNHDLANARAWKVPLYIGEFTVFGDLAPAWNLTRADMAQTAAFLAWAERHHVSWTFWAYVNPVISMTAVDYRDNGAIPVVDSTLRAGH